MQSNMTKELQRGLEAMQVLSTWHSGEILGSQLSSLRPDLILASCLRALVRSQHPWGRVSLSFFSPASWEILFGRWAVAGDGAHGPGHLQAHMVYLLQRDCMMACLDNGHAASSAHVGVSSHNVDSGKGRRHSPLCWWPLWTWGVTWTWVTCVDPSSTQQRHFGVNSKGKGVTYWNATRDSHNTQLLLGDPLLYSLT